MKNIIQDLPCVEVGAGHGLITSEPTTWGMLPAMRHGVIAKTSKPRPHTNLSYRHGTRKNQLIDELSIRDQRLSRWTQSSPCYRTKSLSQNQTPPS